MKLLTKHKKIALLIMSLICILAIFLTLGYRQPRFITNLTGYIVVPPQRAVSSINNWVQKRISVLSNIRELAIENEALQDEVKTLRAENARMYLLEQDNTELRELLHMQQRFSNFSTVGAEVIARDSNNWNSSFIINKGLNDGLSPNMVVLAQGGLVGRIVHSGANFSRVVPLIDDSSSIGAVSSRTGDFGFVRGDLTLSSKGLAKMDLIDPDSEILEGDEIVTSSLGQIFPPGITIGHVIEIQDNPSSLTRVAIIEPIVDFRRISTVLVIDELFEMEFED